MSTRLTLTLTAVLVALGFVSPVYAQGAEAEAAGNVIGQWSIITAGFALGIAAAFGALGQGKAIASTVEAIARNPSAVADIRLSMIIGLVLIESLVIYVLAISLVLFFGNPFTA